eukprot:2567485-Amphidinium_carterae.1
MPRAWRTEFVAHLMTQVRPDVRGGIAGLLGSFGPVDGDGCVADSSRHGAKYTKHFGCLLCGLDGSRTRWFATSQDYTTHQRASHCPYLSLS